MRYTITSKHGMTPWAVRETVAEAIAEAVKAMRQGLDGRIVPDPDATPADCDEAARLLGWAKDPDSADMDRPVSGTQVARDMASRK